LMRLPPFRKISYKNGMTHGTGRFLAFLSLLLLAGCAAVKPIAEPTDDIALGCPMIEQGRASFYAHKFHGRKTASGERFDNNALTAAHRTLPFGTKVIVRNQENG